MVIIPQRTDGNNIVYAISGTYIDDYGNAKVIKDEYKPENDYIHAKISSSDSTAPVFTLQLGTEKDGKIKIVQVKLCE